MKNSFLDNNRKFIPGTLFCCSCSLSCKFHVLLLSSEQMLFLNSDSTISRYGNPFLWDSSETWIVISIITGESVLLSEILQGTNT